MLLAILIPVYNEERLLQRAVDRVLACPAPVGPEGNPVHRRLFIVDDGSSDLTPTVMEGLSRHPDITTIRHERNQGKGAAIRTALAAARDYTGPEGERADLFIIHDADLEYDAGDHGAVLAPIMDGRGDAVIGSRFLGQTHRVLYYWHSLANRFITFCSNVCTNLNLSDIECCTKAFSRGVAERLTIEESRFGVEPELVAKLATMTLPQATLPSDTPTNIRAESPTAPSPPAGASGVKVEMRALRVYEVAVSYAGRTYAEGKKIGWRDGFAALGAIFKYNLMR